MESASTNVKRQKKLLAQEQKFEEHAPLFGLWVNTKKPMKEAGKKYSNNPER